MRNNLVIVFIILITYFSFMNNSQAACPMHDGINLNMNRNQTHQVR